MGILIVEDDQLLTDYIRHQLVERGYAVTTCHDGPEGLRIAGQNPFDIILLDVMIPHLSGIEVARRLRSLSIYTPILMLTARDSPEDIVAGLDAGADDYLTKPFAFNVLWARIRARIRAASQKHCSVLSFSDLTIDTGSHEVRRGSRLLCLTKTEYAILECLIRSAGQIVTRTRLVETIWNNRQISERTIDTFMRLLREKVELPGDSKIIHTERGIGYRLLEY